MTALAVEGDRERCLRVGMNDYVSNPISQEALAEALARWLPEKNDESETPDAAVTSLPVPQASVTPIVFDREGLLGRLMNEEDLAEELTQTFLSDIPRQMESLRGYLEGHNAEGVERLAHAIRGASSNVGGEAMSSTALEIEEAGKTGDLISAAGSIDDLQREFDRLKQAMIRQ